MQTQHAPHAVAHFHQFGEKLRQAECLGQGRGLTVGGGETFGRFFLMPLELKSASKLSASTPSPASGSNQNVTKVRALLFRTLFLRGGGEAEQRGDLTHVVREDMKLVGVKEEDAEDRA